MSRMILRRLAPAVLAGVVALLVPGPAASAAVQAHAQLVSTTPADGEELRTAAEVTLTFSEDVNAQFLQVRVEGPAGDDTDGPATADGHTVTQPLATDLPAGAHTVVYRVVSVDGHPVSGTFTFTTTDGPSASAPSAASGPTPVPASTTPPAVSTPGPSVAADPATAASEGSPSWLVPTLVGLLALLVLVGGAMLARPRRRHRDDAGE
jgi:methionine-rich copper-binding protein CopC